jgi:hypothetical protein
LGVKLCSLLNEFAICDSPQRNPRSQSRDFHPSDESLSLGTPDLGHPTVSSRRLIVHVHGIQRMMRENEERAVVGTAEDEVDGALGHVDLADLLPA